MKINFVSIRDKGVLFPGSGFLGGRSGTFGGSIFGSRRDVFSDFGSRSPFEVSIFRVEDLKFVVLHLLDGGDVPLVVSRELGLNLFVQGIGWWRRCTFGRGGCRSLLGRCSLLLIRGR